MSPHILPVEYFKSVSSMFFACVAPGKCQQKQHLVLIERFNVVTRVELELGSVLMSFADAVWLFCRGAGKCSI